MKTKFLWIAAIMLFSTSTIVAQSGFTFDVSQVVSNFKFDNSDGDKDSDYSSIYTSAYSLGYRKVNDDGFLMRGAIGMRKGGARMTDSDSGLYGSWDLQYINLNLGVGFMAKNGFIKPYGSVGGYFGYILESSQSSTLGMVDPVEADAMEKMDYGAIGSLGIQVKVTNNISLYAEGSYLMGLQNLEKGTQGQQEAYNRAVLATFGFVISLDKDKEETE